MEFTIHKEKIKDALSKMRSCLASGSVNPILEHFLFEIKNSKITVKATNILTSMVWKASVNCKPSFSFSLPGSTLSSLVASLDDDEIKFDYNLETKDVKLSCGGYEWDCVSGRVDDFPKIEIPENLQEISLPENFSEMLNLVYFSIGDEVQKADLNSLSLEITEDKINLISTDRIRLSWSHNSLPVKASPIKFVIPRNSVSEILRINPTKIMFFPENNKCVYFKVEGILGEYIFKTALTNAVYPDIQAYVSNQFEGNEIIIKKSHLIRAIKRIKIVSDKVNKVGTFEFSEENAVISTLGSSSKSKEILGYKSEDGSVPHSFNVRINLLMDYLSLENEEDIKFKIISEMCLVFDKNGYRHVLSLEK